MVHKGAFNVFKDQAKTETIIYIGKENLIYFYIEYIFDRKWFQAHY